MTKYNKIKQIGTFSILMLSLLLISAFISLDSTIHESSMEHILDKDYNNEIKVEAAKYWDNFTSIYILDGNWSNGLNGGWIQGNGSWNNPYIIENMTMDATSSPTGNGIFIENSLNDYIIIQNCTILNAAGSGIRLLNANNVTIRNNNCTNNPNGIYIQNGINNTLSENYITLSDYGIHLDGSEFILISENVVIDNNANSMGIALWTSNNNTIEKNIVSNNFHALYLNGCPNNTITENALSFSDNNGMWIRSGSKNNTVSKNIVFNNSLNGIILDDDSNIATQNLIENNTARGIYVGGGFKYNYIYYNVFKNNGIHADDRGSNNHWNSSKIGNYWDNYTGIDESPKDGIGDTSYDYIYGTANNEDFLPIFENPMFNGTTINIDGLGVNGRTWDQMALLKWWCEGSGTQNNPYKLNALTIDARQTESGITINNSQVYFTIEDCVLLNSSATGAGIYIQNTTNGLINNCMIINNTGDGIYMDPTNDTVISNNLIFNNSKNGIGFIENCYKNLIFNNTIWNNGDNGIYLNISCNNNTIFHNNITENTNNGIYIQNDCYYNNITSNNITLQTTFNGIYIEDYSANNTIADNIINDNHNYGIDIRYSNGTKILRNILNSNDQSGLAGRYSDHTSIINNTMNQNAGHGLTYSEGYNITMRGNTANDNNNGIHWSNVDFSKLINNTAYSNNVFYGLWLENCDNNTISENILTSNDDYGIYMAWCTNNTLSHNIAKNPSGTYQDRGLHMNAQSNRNTISNNEFVDNNEYGIYLQTDCDDNKILNNIVKNDVFSIQDVGVYITGGSGNNTISSNDLTDNLLVCITIYSISHDNIVINNTIIESATGIDIVNSDRNLVKNNTIADNTNYGIHLDTGAENNTILENTIRNNGQTGGVDSYTYAGIYIESNSHYNKIINNTIYNDGTDYQNSGIAIVGSNNCTIYNNTIYDNQDIGLYLETSESNIITENTITTNGGSLTEGGIYCRWSSYNLIQDNNLSNNNANGIYCYQDCNYNDIIHNNVENNLDTGIYLYMRCSYNEIINNTLGNDGTTSQQDGIYLREDCSWCNITGNIANGNTFSGIVITDSNHTLIMNNTADLNNNPSNDNGYGIQIFTNCYWTIITENNARNNKMYGIYVRTNSDNTTISNNIVTLNGRHGIYVFDSSDYCNITDNDVLNNGGTIYHGILITGTHHLIKHNRIGNDGPLNQQDGINIGGSYHIIENNTIFNNRQCGIFLTAASNTYITENNIYSNNRADQIYGAGIRIFSNANHNDIYNNTIFNNTRYGLILHQTEIDFNNISFNLIANSSTYGIFIVNVQCSDNLIFNNTFVNNSQNARDDGTNNAWDNGTIGNYWDDYSGIDWDDDGIGDTYYNIPGGANANDTRPIWYDGPTAPAVYINSPSNNTSWGTAPYLNIDVFDIDFKYLWYNVSDDKEFLEPGVQEQLRADIWENIPEDTWFTIHIYANDSKGNINNSLTLRLYCDGTAPRMIINTEANFSSVNDLFSIEVVVSDPNFNYTWYNVTGLSGREFLKNSTIEQFNITFWNQLNHGWFTIEFYANDSFGNINNTFTLVLFKDIRAPWLTLLGPANFSSNNTAPYISVIALDRDLEYIWYNITGLPDIEFLANNTAEQLDLAKFWNILPDIGWYTINFFANDSYGQRNETFSLVLYKDTLAPWITINAPLNNSITADAPILNITVSDRNLHYIWYTVDGQAGQEFLTNNTEETLLSTYWENVVAQTWFIIRIYANDTLGQTNNTYTLSIYKDNQPPSIDYLNLQNNSIYSEAPEILVIASDFSLHYIWYICNGVQEFLTNNTAERLLDAVWTGLNQGEFQIIIYANDTSGKESNATIFLIKDIESPLLDLLDIKIGEIADVYDTAKVTVTWSVKDKASGLNRVEIKLDDGKWIEVNVKDGKVKYTFKDVELGKHEVQIRAYDNAELKASQSDDFKVKRETPDINITIGMTLILGVALIAGLLGIVFFRNKTKQVKLREQGIK